MGACVSSDGKQGTAAGKNPPAVKPTPDSPAAAPTSAAVLPAQNPFGDPGQKPVATPNNSASLTEHLDALPPLFCERTLKDRSGKDSSYLITAVSKPGALEVGCSMNGGNDLYSAEITVQQLEHQLKQLNPPANGAAFAKAMKDAFENRTVVVEPANVVVVKVPIGDSQLPVGQLRQSRGADKALRNRLFSTPMFHYWASRKSGGKLPAHETESVDVERKTTRLRAAGNDAARCRDLRRRIERMQGGGAGPGKEFDPSAAGPSTYVLHLDQSTTHVPALFSHNEAAMTMIRKQHAAANEMDGVPAAPTDAEVNAIVGKANGKVHESVVKSLDRLDEWGFDMFDFASTTENTALFHTTYALLHKHGLMGYFGLDHDTVVRFLSALEAGYHGNHYHNATHAADVLQCVHYILGPAGMIRELRLMPEEVLAALLSSAMHDYDHPGLNNMYHIKTGAYLATLYNDRSVLENHHCASVFELLRHDRYNIFRHLSEDQRKSIRDTMLEMVLSTDMGLHTKISNQFKQRHKDLEGDGGADKKPRADIWKKPDDRRLALSIVLKMADISNCARPLNLYKGWAGRIADEFYLQGDLEREMGIAISPFMDRTKHDTDFPKGQTSFMRFIAIPLFELGAEFLPKMEFAVQMMQSNQDHWQNGGDKNGEV